MSEETLRKPTHVHRVQANSAQKCTIGIKPTTTTLNKHCLYRVCRSTSFFLSFFFLFKLKTNSPDEYLSEAEAVLVLLLVLHLEVVERFPLRWRLGQRPDALHVACRQEAVAAVQLAVVPVLVHLPSQDDDVTLVELEVTGLFALVAVQRLAAGQLRDVLQRTTQTIVTSEGPLFLSYIHPPFPPFFRFSPQFVYIAAHMLSLFFSFSRVDDAAVLF